MPLLLINNILRIGDRNIQFVRGLFPNLTHMIGLRKIIDSL